MTADLVTVHVAGPLQLGGLRQECARCGHVLEDWTGRQVMVAVEPGDTAPPTLPCWPDGERIGRRGNLTYVVQRGRELDEDERECRPTS